MDKEHVGILLVKFIQATGKMVNGTEKGLLYNLQEQFFQDIG